MANIRTRQRRHQPAMTVSELTQAMREAGRDPAAWAALRAGGIRTLSARMTVDQATRLFDALARRPELVPTAPPRMAP